MTEALPPHQAPRSSSNPYPPSDSDTSAGSGIDPQQGPQPYEPYPPSPQPYSSYRPGARTPFPQQQPTSAGRVQQPRQQQPVPPGYQQPVPGAAPAQPPRRRRTGLVILVVALVVVLVAGGGAAAWWFVLRDRGAAYEPQMVIPADEWADGATQVGSSTIAKDATIAASPDGSFLAALSENESSGTGRPPGRKRTLTGYSLADGRASESWRIDTNNGDADINF